MKLLPATLDHDQDQLRRRYVAIQACFDAFQDHAGEVFSDEKNVVKLGITVGAQEKGTYTDFRFGGETIRLRREFALAEGGVGVGVVRITQRRADTDSARSLGAFIFASNGKTGFGIGKDDDAETAMLSTHCPEIIAYYFRLCLTLGFEANPVEAPLPL